MNIMLNIVDCCILEIQDILMIGSSYSDRFVIAFIVGVLESALIDTCNIKHLKMQLICQDNDSQSHKEMGGDPALKIPYT
jgi:hypothetical protein